MFGITSLRVWFRFLRWMRPNITLELKLVHFYRYIVLKNLAQNGVFEYFKEPHTFEEFVDHFQVVVEDSYAPDLMKTLTKFKILVEENQHYHLNHESKDPVLKYLLEYTPEEIPDEIPSFLIAPELLNEMNELFQEYAGSIFKRLQGNFYGFTGGVQLFNWDSTFTLSLYKNGRECALLMAKANKLKNGRVLDVGCANGHGTADLWGRLHSRGNEIYGIDRSEDLLKIAQDEGEFTRWLKNQGYNPPYDSPFPKFSKMNIEELSFPDNYFDLIVANYVIHWFTDQQKAIKEMARVLKPGGKICGTQAGLDVSAAQWAYYILRTVKGVSGTAPEKDLRRYFANAGLRLSRRTMAGFFCAVKPKK
ncbi:MAG: class I SAM-dependent methyltransferase [Promethearchaeota archaeon]